MPAPEEAVRAERNFGMFVKKDKIRYVVPDGGIAETDDEA